MTDEELLTAIAKQDADAFGEFFKRFEPQVNRHLNRISRDQATADDLSQDVFYRVWERAEQWSGKGSARSWLLTIATNLALNHIRTVKRRRERPLDPMPDPYAEDDETLAPSWMIDESAVGADEQLERAERSQLLTGLVNELPDDKREVLQLVYNAELDIRDVAEQLGIPEGTVKSRMFHARRRLVDRWQAIEDREARRYTDL
jgi:RNA polymerase sigma-70 factor, ECF subfamily